MDQRPRSGGSPSLSSAAPVSGHDPAPSEATASVGASYYSNIRSLASIPSCGASVSGTRPRRSWDTAFPNCSRGEGGSSGELGGAGRRAWTGAGPDVTSRPKAVDIRGAMAVAAEGAAASATNGSAVNSISFPGTEEATLRSAEKATGMSAGNGTPRGRNDGSPADGGLPCGSSRIGSAVTSSSSLDLPDPPTVTSARDGGAASSEDELADTDEGVMARLTEFTEIARRTAARNEDLSRELAAEKRRVAQTTRKLEQSNMTSMELRESLALAQDTVMRLREHEMAWAERTASEMSLRSEMCALKDDLSRVSGENSAIKKRCDLLQRENTELSQRFTAIAEEKRQVESKARRLLRSDRYRGY